MQDIAEAPKAQGKESGFDQTLAELLLLITHHGISENQAVLESIIDRLDALCKQSELEFFPQQQLVIHKIRKLWQLKLLHSAADNIRH